LTENQFEPIRQVFFKNLSVVPSLLSSLTYILGTCFAISSFRIHTGSLHMLPVDLSAGSFAFVESQSNTKYLIEYDPTLKHSTTNSIYFVQSIYDAIRLMVSRETD